MWSVIPGPLTKLGDLLGQIHKGVRTSCVSYKEDQREIEPAYYLSSPLTMEICSLPAPSRGSSSIMTAGLGRTGLRSGYQG